MTNTGLQCPSCGSLRLQVKDSRHVDGTQRRRRICFDCGEAFNTIEIIAPKDVVAE